MFEDNCPKILIWEEQVLRLKRKENTSLANLLLETLGGSGREMPRQMLLKARSNTKGKDEDHSGARPKARSTGARPEGRSAEARSGPKVKAEVRRGETRGQKQGPQGQS